MNIYLLEVKTGFYGGYNSYDSHVVIAKSPRNARKLCPSGNEGHIWNDVEKTKLTVLGKAYKNDIEHVVCSSFNAG